MRKSFKAFTLIELVVVIAILGILSLIAIPAFTGFREAADAAQVNSDAHNYARVKLAEAELSGTPGVIQGTSFTSHSCTATVDNAGVVTDAVAPCAG